VGKLSFTFNDFSRAEEKVREAYKQMKENTPPEQVPEKQMIQDFVRAYEVMAKIGNYITLLDQDRPFSDVLKIDRIRDEWRPVYRHYRALLQPEA
jgi:hypothetical protein